MFRPGRVSIGEDDEDVWTGAQLLSCLYSRTHVCSPTSRQLEVINVGAATNALYGSRTRIAWDHDDAPGDSRRTRNTDQLGCEIPEFSVGNTAAGVDDAGNAWGGGLPHSRQDHSGSGRLHG